MLAALEAAAQSKTQAWLRRFRKDIFDLPEGARQGYLEVKLLASKPELFDREPYPRTVQAVKTDRSWGQHV